MPTHSKAPEPASSVPTTDTVTHEKKESVANPLINHVKLPTHDGPHHHHANDDEDIAAQQAAGDYSGEYGKRTYCSRHYHSMTPLRILFILGGRYPFYSSKEDEGTYEYTFSWFFPGTLYFLAMSLLTFYILVVGTVDIVHISLNYSFTEVHNTESYQEQRELEDVLIQRYYIPLIFVFSSLIHGCIASALTISKRHYIAHYLTFWSKAVYTMHMDVSRQALGFSVKVMIVFIAVVAGLTMLTVHKIGPTAIGLPTVFGDLIFRPFIPVDGWLREESATRFWVQVTGAVCLVATFTASKGPILMFVYHCKLLQSAFAYWNGRVYAAVLRGGELAQTEAGRTTYKLLFKDHCVLMDLMEGMDQVFAFTVESYFGCQVFSLFFELYFCIRTAKYGDNRFAAAYPEKPSNAFFVRPKDWAPGIVMMFVSISIMLSASKSAADVAEEAMAGLEVLRRKTMLGRKSDEELYFMLSMFSSYTAYKKMEITGGGYLYMNKDLIIGLISNVLSYFIILYQFQPVMDRSYSGAEGELRDERKKFGMFLANVEGLEGDHYETTPSSSDPWESFRHSFPKG